MNLFKVHFVLLLKFHSLSHEINVAIVHSGGISSRTLLISSKASFKNIQGVYYYYFVISEKPALYIKRNSVALYRVLFRKKLLYLYYLNHFLTDSKLKFLSVLIFLYIRYILYNIRSLAPNYCFILSTC